MLEDQQLNETRLDELEEEITKLKAASATGRTWFGSLFGALCLVAFIYLMAKLPLTDNPSGKDRLFIGVLSFLAGASVFGAAVAFVKFLLKAMVETAYFTVFLLNILAGSIVWMFFTPLVRFLAERKLVAQDELVPAVFIGSAIALFLIDVLFALIFYPLAKLAGSSVFEESESA